MTCKNWRNGRTALAAALILAFAAHFAAPLSAAPSAAPLGTEAPEARIALVIGNGAYPNVPLKNPVNDARDLAAALTSLGFSVTLVLDGDMAAMTRAIRDFGTAIRRPDAVALFFYSGHGIQYRGANYLIPAKSDIRDPDELAFSAVNSDQVYAKMESAGDRTNIVILDACRNNPFPGSERASERGLAVVGSAPPQSLIVYATAPGKTAQDGSGRNGVFTAALLKHLQDPGLDAELMIRKVREDVIAATDGAQVPWHNSSIAGAGFVFAPRKPSAPAQPTPAQSAAAIAPASGSGVVNLRSEPAGMRILIDDADEVVTPATLELSAGAHSFEPLESVIDRVYYGPQPLQWITVPSGTAINVPVRIKAETAELRLKLVPPGFRAFVGDQELGEAPFAPVEVKAGYFNVRFEKEGENPVNIPSAAMPGSVVNVSWGEMRAVPIRLQRATIKLDGLEDSWEGVEPLYESASPSPFMGEPKSGIKAVYLCRDDKYLYWRVDFVEVDPLAKRPKGVGKGLNLQIDVWREATKEGFNMIAQYNSEANGNFYLLGGSSPKGQWARLSDGNITAKRNKNIFVARIDWAWVQKHFPDTVNPRCILVNNDQKWNWVQSTKIDLNLGWIDFTK